MLTFLSQHLQDTGNRHLPPSEEKSQVSSRGGNCLCVCMICVHLCKENISAHFTNYRSLFKLTNLSLNVIKNLLRIGGIIERKNKWKAGIQIIFTQNYYINFYLRYLTNRNSKKVKCRINRSEMKLLTEFTFIIVTEFVIVNCVKTF